MNIIETDWSWAWSLTPRSLTTELVLHHAAADGSAAAVHASHLARGWVGIAYHYYVRKDGSVWRGRPENAVGGHTGGHNDRSIGICFEGNFQQNSMSAAQLAAGRELIAELRARYPGIAVFRHRDLNSTACPGANFPFEEMTESMAGEEIFSKLSEYLDALPQSGWSREEGWWQKAGETAVMDGCAPRGLVTREQLAALLGRLGLLDGKERI